jgi:pimeloyl-ACP methyl ester carboxylesterase
METTTRWIDTDGARLWAELSGRGETVTMLHGFLLDSGQWDGEFAALAPSRQVLRYDARGFGRSSIEPGRRYAHHEDLAAVLDACGIGRTLLLACSGGAATALDFALAWPERVSALVLVGAGYWGRYADATPAARAFLQAVRARDVPGLIDSSLRAFTDGPRRRPEEVDAAVRRRVDAMTSRLFRRPTSYWTGAAHDQRTPQPDALTRLHELRMPVRLLVGSEDQPEVHALSQQLVTGIAGARLEVLPDAGHHANLEVPQAVLAAVREVSAAAVVA